MCAQQQKSAFRTIRHFCPLCRVLTHGQGELESYVYVNVRMRVQRVQVATTGSRFGMLRD